MRILLVHNYYRDFGGEDGYVLGLKKLLIAHKHQVAVYAKYSRDIHSLQDKLLAARFITDNPATYRQISDLIERFKPDVVQVQNVFPLISPSVYRACRDRGVPLVQRLSNYRLLCPKATLFRNGAICESCVARNYPLSAVLHGCYHHSRLASYFLSGSIAALKSHLTELVSAYIFPSPFALGYHTKFLSLPKNRLHIVPTFAELPPLARLPSKRDYFLYAGRLSEEKGIIELLEAVKTLPQLTLVVAGDGPLRDRVAGYRQYKNITVLGHLTKNKLALRLSQASLTVIPSNSYDTFPQVLLESFRTGTPVLAPSVGSFPALVKQGVTGFLYKPGRLKQMLQFAFKHRKELSNMGNNALKVCRSEYSADDHYRQLMKIYQAAIAHPVKARG